MSKVHMEGGVGGGILTLCGCTIEQTMQARRVRAWPGATANEDMIAATRDSVEGLLWRT